MEGLIAVAVVTLLVGKKEVAFEPGRPLPELPDAEGERLVKLGAANHGNPSQRKPSGRKAKDGATPPAGGAKTPPGQGEGQGQGDGQADGEGGAGGEGGTTPPAGTQGGGTPTP